MTTKVVTDGMLGVLGRRYHELFDRVRKGVLDGMQALIEGTAPTGSLVDLDADPFVPEGWEVKPEDQLPHRARGVIDFATSKVGLHLAEAQKSGSVGGKELRVELADRSVLGANALDFYLANPHRIPEDWKAKYVSFWGTFYRCGVGRLCVRCLYWDGDRWDWDYRWLDSGWDFVCPGRRSWQAALSP